MVATNGMDVIPFCLKHANCIEYFLTARSSIYEIAKQVEAVSFLQPDNLSQKAAEGSLAAVDIGDDETTYDHGLFYTIPLSQVNRECGRVLKIRQITRWGMQ